jgi:hypothetical protein
MLPADYRSLLDVLGPGEGFVATRFLRLYPVDELASVNSAYGVEAYLPGHLLFGSDGIGQAFLFDWSPGHARVVEMPFIPLDPEYLEATYADFIAFLEAIATVPDRFTGPLPIVPNPAMAGLEVHEKHPVVLGGDPTSLDNKLYLAPAVHAQACTYFNRLFRDLRTQARNG